MPGSEKPTGLTAARIEVITWVLIFGGMVGAGLGLFVDRQPGGAMLGGVFILGGLVAVALGIALIIVRSRMSPPHGRPKEGSLPLGGTARSAKDAQVSDGPGPKAKR